MKVWGQLERAQIEPLSSDPSTTTLVGRIWFNTVAGLPRYSDGSAVQTFIIAGIGQIVNGDINASAAIAGTKISPNFGSQNILTTGTMGAASGTITGQLSINSVLVGSAANTISGLATIINSGTLTLPTASDTLVGRATTDTLTNKLISGSSNTITNIADGSLTSSYITADGTRPLTGSWSVGNFSIYINATGPVIFSAGNNEQLVSKSTQSSNSFATAAAAFLNAPSNTTTGAGHTQLIVNAQFSRTTTSNVSDGSSPLYGIQIQLVFTPSGSTTYTNTASIGNFSAFNIAALTKAGAGTLAISNYAAISIAADATSGITNKFGIYLGGITAGTNNAAIADATPSGSYFIYSTNTNPTLLSGSLTASNFSGTSSGSNSGDVTMGTANGLSIVGQALSMAAAGASTTGVVTSGAQSFGGNKNFVNASGFGGTSTTDTVIYIRPGSLSTDLTAATQQGVMIDTAISANATAQFISFYSDANVAASATMNRLFHFYAGNVANGASATLTQQVQYGGVAPSRGTNNAFLYDGGTTALPTGSWGVYLSTTNPSYFGGKLYVIPGTSLSTGTAGAKVGGAISLQSSSSNSSVTTTETTFFTTTLTANSLTNAGEGITVVMSGSLAANSNSKVVKFYFGGSNTITLFTSTASNSAWFAYINVSRITSTQAAFSGFVTIAGAVIATIANTGSAVAFGSDNTVKVTGTGVSTGDITGYTFRMIYESF